MRTLMWSIIFALIGWSVLDATPIQSYFVFFLSIIASHLNDIRTYLKNSEIRE